MWGVKALTDLTDCRKLLGQQPDFDDLKGVHPDIYASLQKLLLMSAAEVDALELKFQVGPIHNVVEACLQRLGHHVAAKHVLPAARVAPKVITAPVPASPYCMLVQGRGCGPVYRLCYVSAAKRALQMGAGNCVGLCW